MLDKAVKEIGKNVTGVQGDAGKIADLDRLFAIVENEKGRIDVAGGDHHDHGEKNSRITTTTTVMTLARPKR